MVSLRGQLRKLSEIISKFKKYNKQGCRRGSVGAHYCSAYAQTPGVRGRQVLKRERKGKEIGRDEGRGGKEVWPGTGFGAFPRPSWLSACGLSDTNLL